MRFGFSKAPSQSNGSFEFPQHMFWLRNKKNNFSLRTLIWEPGIMIIETRVYIWFHTAFKTFIHDTTK